MKRLLGDASWSADLQTVISTYPITSAATEALAELLAAGELVDAYQEGLVYYRHFRNEEALAALDRSLAEAPSGPNAAAAHYYRAATQERLGDIDTALAEYAASYSLDPSGALADDALWWEGRLLEGEGRYSEAADRYERLARDYAASEWAAEAAFREGLVLYKERRFSEATNVWRSAASTAGDREEMGRAMLWAAKGEIAGGDKDIGVAHLQELSREYPLNFYGLRAGVLLAEMGVSLKATPTAPGATAQPAGNARSWLSSVTGKPPVSVWTLWLDRRWVRGQELITLGLPHQAGAEFRALIDDYAGQPMALLALSESFRLLKETEMSSRSAQRILDKLSGRDAAAAPPEMLSLAYPEDYMSLIESAETAEGVSPLVMLALIRQESFFDPLAGSGAGALGLTQVMPPTAKEIAGELKLTGFADEELFRPAVSIIFGAHYLSNQLSSFDGNLYYALAAYNAGPGSAARWQSAAGDDVDLFLEEIDAGQANLYVRRVMENLAVYRYLYGGSAGPSLVGE
jgi:soluble lytic murein transglycosylase